MRYSKICAKKSYFSSNTESKEDSATDPGTKEAAEAAAESQAEDEKAKAKTTEESKPKTEEQKTEAAEETKPEAAKAKDDTAEEKTSLTLHKVGDFWEMYDNDARVASAALGLYLTRKGKVAMCGFPDKENAAAGNGRRLIAFG